MMVSPTNGQMSETKKRPRSPGYPAFALEQALQKAEVIRKENNKNEAHVDAILDLLGYKPKSGSGLVALSTLLKFGLMTVEGSGDTRRARLTPLALNILLDDRPDSPERLAYIKEAALTPVIHRKIWNKFQGAIPSDPTLRVYLRRDENFTDEAAGDLIKHFRNTLSYAKLTQSDNISPEVEDKQEPDGELRMAPPPAINPPSSQPQSTQNSSEQSQQITRTVQIPLTGAPWAMLQVPYPMTEENWEEMKLFLDLMKRPLTTKEQPKQS